MTSIENIKTSNNGFELTFELKQFPVTFVNAVRRLCISGVPTVVLRDVQILENTSQIPHEMLKHRVEMLPINVSPEDMSTVRDAKIELRMLPADKLRLVTTDEFVVESGRESILMRDRDLKTPILFLRLKAGESVHIRAKLAIENVSASQVCTATTAWHVDPELAKVNRKTHIESGGDPRHFDNFLIQRSFSRDEKGRPNWFDMLIESVGVLPSKVILRMANSILKRMVEDYTKSALEAITREQDEGTYSVTLEKGGHTIGALMQEVIYSDQNVKFVSYDIPHPLKPQMVLRFNTTKTPESILKVAMDTIVGYCAAIEKVL